MTARVESAAVVRPKVGEIVSGDDAFILEVEQGFLAAIVDVLGHGEEADALAIRIRTFLTGIGSDALVDVLSRLHRECRGSRGAAVGLCFIETATGRLASRESATPCSGDSARSRPGSCRVTAWSAGRCGPRSRRHCNCRTATSLS